jgi:hypothetical protein
MIALLLLFSTVTSTLTLFDDVIRVPRSQWRAINVNLQQRPATIQVKYKVTSGRSGVRVVIMTRDDVRRFQEGLSHRVLAQSPFQAEGNFRHLVANPGEYQVLLDNRLEGRGPAEVRLAISLLFHEFTSFEPRTLPDEVRRQVVAVSLLLFAVVAGWSGWRVWHGFRMRPSSRAANGDERTPFREF